MRTTAEIVREAVNRAASKRKVTNVLTQERWRWARRLAELAATYACELAQADAAALLKPVTMRKEEGGTRRAD